jgi:hypothetical protein
MAKWIDTPFQPQKKANPKQRFPDLRRHRYFHIKKSIAEGLVRWVRKRIA